MSAFSFFLLSFNSKKIVTKILQDKKSSEQRMIAASKGFYSKIKLSWSHLAQSDAKKNISLRFSHLIESRSSFCVRFFWFVAFFLFLIQTKFSKKCKISRQTKWSWLIIHNYSTVISRWILAPWHFAKCHWNCQFIEVRL